MMPRMRRLAALPLAALLASACGTPKPSQREPSPPPPAAQPRPDVLLERALALRAEGDLEGARERLEVAHGVAPADAGVSIELADVLLADGREVDRAAALLHGVQERGPRWYLLAARFAELRGDDLAAEMAYRRAIAEAPEVDARLRHALVLERLGRDEEATAELERVREERPGDPIARDRLAARYEAAGRLADAEVELTALAEEQPERAVGWERLARFYERTGRAADARAALARARGTAGGGRVLRPLLPSKR
jgi:predicted Zn-dependent protease